MNDLIQWIVFFHFEFECHTGLAEICAARLDLVPFSHNSPIVYQINIQVANTVYMQLLHKTLKGEYNKTFGVFSYEN